MDPFKFYPFQPFGLPQQRGAQPCALCSLHDLKNDHIHSAPVSTNPHTPSP